MNRDPLFGPILKPVIALLDRISVYLYLLSFILLAVMCICAFLAYAVSAIVESIASIFAPIFR